MLLTRTRWRCDKERKGITMTTTSTRRYPITDAEPRTAEEASALAYELERATARTPEPAAILHSYSKTGRVTLQSLLPQVPCWGPPLPRASGVLWPNEVRDPLYRTLKKGKPHRQMQLDVLPDSFPRIDVHVLGRRMEGQFIKNLVNNSDEIDIPAGSLSTTLDTAEESAQARLLDAVQGSSDAIPKGYMIQQASEFVFRGAWTLIKAIWEYLVHKTITVDLDVPVDVPGYETDDYIVDSLRQQFVSNATIPVREVKWHII